MGRLSYFFALIFVGRILALGAAEPPAPVAKNGPPQRSPIPVARETTFFLGPIDDRGYVDFASALDERRRNVRPDDNALVGLWQAYGGYGIHNPRALPPPEYFAALGIAPPRSDGDYLDAEQDFLQAYDRDLHDGIWKNFAAAEERIWTAREFPIVFAWLERNNRALDRAVAASKKPKFYRPIVRKPTADSLVVAMFPNDMTTIRALSRHLTLRAHYLMGEGKFSAAWDDLLALRRLARLAAPSSTLVEMLVAYSLDDDARRAERSFLAANRLSPAELRRCLTELKELPPLPSPAEAVDFGERAHLLDMLQEMSRGNYLELNVLEGPLTDDNRRVLAAEDYVGVMRAANRWYDRVAAALRLPNAAARVAAFQQLESERKRLDEKFQSRRTKPAPDDDRRIDLLRPGELADFLLSNDTLLTVLKHRPHDQREQQFALSKVGIALAAYRAKHGRYPDRLDELRPDYFTTLPGDLYTNDAPLHYVASAEGYKLYSVGPDGRGDHGENNQRDAAAAIPADDIALRVKPNPD